MEERPAPTFDPAAAPATGSLSLSLGLVRMRRVLVGSDERPASRDALALGRALCEPTGAELVVASVRARRPELIGPRLKELAAGDNADLIVVGSTHRGRLGRVLPGSVGERVLDDAPCAVAIAPLGLADRGLSLERIAIAYDGSREAGAALDLAAELAECVGASLAVLGAVALPLELDLASLRPATLEEAEVGRMRRHLERARQRVPSSVPVETRLLRGPPQRAIVEAAAGSDLLVLGSRGHYGQERRLFLGSVATRASRSAPCATLIVPTA